MCKFEAVTQTEHQNGIRVFVVNKCLQSLNWRDEKPSLTVLMCERRRKNNKISKDIRVSVIRVVN